jgi:hypothetical protein
MSRRSNRAQGKTRGQALAEFALVAPIFFILLFALIEFGRYVYYAQILNNAAREGARYAIVHGSTSLCPSGPLPGGAANSCDPTGARIVSIIKSAAVGIAGDSIAPVLSWTDDYGNASDNARGHTFTVTVSAPFVPIIPLVIPSLTVEGASSLVINH